MINEQEQVVGLNGFQTLRHLGAKIVLTLMTAFILAFQVQAQESPVGTWHYTISGSDRGIMNLTFFDDGTLEGLILLIPLLDTNGISASSVSGRVDIEGGWNMDPQTGRVLGAFSGGVDPQEEGSGFDASFEGNVRRGKFNARGSGSNGGFRMTGVPETFDLPDLSGDWIIRGRTSSGFFVESVTLFPSFDGIPGVYEIEGRGAIYDVVGTVIIIAKNRMAMDVSTTRDGAGEGAEEGVRVVTGVFNARRDRATLTGIMDDEDAPAGISRMVLTMTRISGGGE